jgi:enoyl-[acyl-carrier-protein] reductase (NADH)
MDDMLNNLMLQTTLSVNTNNPQSAIKQLAEMNQAKSALNSVMKYLDK